MKLTEEQSKLLSDNVEYIQERVKAYHFQPPLNYSCCLDYVLFELCTRITKYNPDRGKIKPFLYINIRNLVYSYYKKHHPNHSTQPDSECNNIWTVTPTEPPDVYNDPDYWKEREEYEIACCINDLPCKDRNIILLFYYDNQTEEYIGRMFGVTKQAICQRLHKVLNNLKPKIAERLEELDRIRNEVL